MKPARNNPAPIILTALVLAALIFVTRGAGMNTEGLNRYFAEVAERVDELPYRIGPYLGVDVAVAPAAQEILRPNRVLQRRFTDPATGKSFDLLVVHCMDVRDMNGHYPPVCYPAHGWIEEARTPMPVASTLGEIDARFYHFRRETEHFEQRRIDILGFFILPGEEHALTGSGQVIDRATRSRNTTRMGAAQLQIITDAGMDPETRRKIWDMVIETCEPVMRRVNKGVGHDDA